MAVDVSISCMPATSILFRHLRGTYSASETTANRPVLTHETLLSSRMKRYKRSLGFGSTTMESMGESQSDLTRATTIELDNRKTTQTVVDGGPPPEGLPGNEIHHSTRIQAYSESRKSSAGLEANTNVSACQGNQASRSMLGIARSSVEDSLDI